MIFDIRKVPDDSFVVCWPLEKLYHRHPKIVLKLFNRRVFYYMQKLDQKKPNRYTTWKRIKKDKIVPSA